MQDTTKETGMQERTKQVLLYGFAALIVLGEILAVVGLIFVWVHGVSTTDQGVVNLVYAMCTGYHSAFMIVIGYIFGSSAGSAAKNNLLGALGKGQANEPPKP